MICSRKIPDRQKCLKRKILFRDPSTYASHTSNVYDKILMQKIEENKVIFSQDHLNISGKSGGVCTLKDQR